MRGNGLYLDRRTSEARIALRIAEVSAAVSTEVTFEHSFLPPGASVLIIGGSRDASTLALMRRRAQGACGGYVRAGSPTGAAVLICVYPQVSGEDRKSTRLNSSHVSISYAVFCLKKKIQDRIF